MRTGVLVCLLALSAMLAPAVLGAQPTPPPGPPEPPPPAVDTVPAAGEVPTPAVPGGGTARPPAEGTASPVASPGPDAGGVVPPLPGATSPPAAPVPGVPPIALPADPSPPDDAPPASPVRPLGAWLLALSALFKVLLDLARRYGPTLLRHKQWLRLTTLLLGAGVTVTAQLAGGLALPDALVLGASGPAAMVVDAVVELLRPSAWAKASAKAAAGAPG